MKRKLGIILALLVTITKGYSLYFDWSLRDSLSFVYFAGSTNTNSQMLVNSASILMNLYLDDKKYLSFGLSDYYLLNGNVGTNHIFIDKVFVNYTGDTLQFVLGRNYFKKLSGLVMAAKGDGLNFKAILLGTEIDLLVLYYGLLPTLISSFEFNPEDQLQGSKRYTGGISISRYDLIGEKLSLGFFYSFDTSTNTKYQPFYLELHNVGSFGGNTAYRFAFVYQGGQNQTATVSSFAGVFDFIWKISGAPKAGMILSLGYASGDADRTSVYPSGNTNSTDLQFNIPGFYDTGLILFPKFSNLIVAKLSGFLSLQDILVINLNAMVLNKAVALAPISDSGANLNSSYLGTEFSIMMKAHLDYSLDLILSAGIFLKGDAYSEKSMMYKIFTGANYKI
ncbi:MAG: hypothetical protein A2Y33_01480 [Spirochaetes bacterium GWF1_51_8]|nr:MAG: hypothetical protein A2Y33_01480 [Spirochaetes bacterium GWF1_51_8]